MDRRARDAKRERFSQNLIVPGSFIIRVQEEMTVCVYKAWKQSHSREVDYGSIGWNPELGRRTNALDAIAPYEHDPSARRLVGRAVPDTLGTEHDRGFLLRRKRS